MSGKAPVIYWDTNVFLAYCKNEDKFGEAILKAIEETIKEIESNHLQLATSTIAFAELVRGNPSDEQKKQIKAVFTRPNTHFIDTNLYIAELAGEIYRSIGTNSKTRLTIPDCIHLASASYFKCAVFYTLDGIKGKDDGILTNAEQLEADFEIKVKTPSITGTIPLPF